MLLTGDVSAAIVTHLKVALLLGRHGFGGEGDLGSFVMTTGAESAALAQDPCSLTVGHYQLALDFIQGHDASAGIT